MDEYIDNNQVAVDIESIEDAKLHLKRIRLSQKQLRQIKKEVNHSIKVIRSSFTAQKAEVGKPTFKSGFLGGLIGKKKLGKMNALQKENLRRQQNAALSPYEHVVLLIDQSLLILDDLKLQLDNWLLENK
jgi:hypothetical protein